LVLSCGRTTTDTTADAAADSEANTTTNAKANAGATSTNPDPRRDVRHGRDGETRLRLRWGEPVNV
jgi:hypothetical protein